MSNAQSDLGPPPRVSVNTLRFDSEIRPVRIELEVEGPPSFVCAVRDYARKAVIDPKSVVAAVTRIHQVTFFSPGSFVSEQQIFDVESWDVKAAHSKCSTLNVNHCYAFQFSTYLTAPDVPDGEGGFLKVRSKYVAGSGVYFLPGSVLTVEQVAERNVNGRDDILLSNMRNNWPIIVEVVNGWRNTLPFEEKDVMLSTEGDIVERGDTPERIAYRAKVLGR